MIQPATPSMTDFDRHLWCQSRHYRCYQKLGAHRCHDNGVEGTHFAVWAPNAARLSVIGDFNGWNENSHPLEKNRDTGIWSGFVAGVEQGQSYKYSIHSLYNGYRTQRADPFAFYAEVRPQTASRVWDISTHQWGDADWMEQRSQWDPQREPVSIYEVHLGSWIREDGEPLTYRELAPRLADYVRKMGYTHVELMPVTEYPFDGSWGYQVVGYFAPTSRFGSPEDFMVFIDTLHQAGIGVILDWVPAHFPTDGFALGYFDGTHLYEHADPRKGFHPEWSTFIFNYGRNEVRNFLISSALFWLDRYHIDGIRVDAVASMLYLDYGRQEGEWVPNQFGGRENLEAISFLQELNRAIREEFPGVITMAEESTSYPHVTGDQGLGFTFKWDMGWMNDTLEYIEKESIHRRYHHHNLTFGMFYHYSENFMLPLSHDEVVHGKSSLLHKMPGDDWQKFANLRLLFGYKTGFPGKKLLFMGGELAQRAEWNFAGQLDWHLLEYAPHQQIQDWVKRLNHLYQQEPALYQLDNHPDGFEWLDCNDADHSLLSFIRRPEGGQTALMFLCNFTPVPRLGHRVALPWAGSWTLVANSDDPQYGGSGVGLVKSVESEPVAHQGREQSTLVDFPPLGVVIFRGERSEETQAQG